MTPSHSILAAAIAKPWPALSLALHVARWLHTAAIEHGPEHAAARARAVFGTECAVSDTAWWTWIDPDHPKLRRMTAGAIAAQGDGAAARTIVQRHASAVDWFNPDRIAARRQEFAALVGPCRARTGTMARGIADQTGLRFRRGFPLRALVRRLGPLAAPLLADVREARVAAFALGELALPAVRAARDLDRVQRISELQGRLVTLAEGLATAPSRWEGATAIKSFWVPEFGCQPARRRGPDAAHAA